MKATIALLLVLFTSIATFGQTTETRYYNGKYTKETALKKVNEYLKITQSDGRLKFVGGASSTYQINGIWELKINEKDKIVVGVRYLIEDKSLSISIVSVIVHKDGGLITLSPKSTNEAIREAYDNQVNLFTKVPFDYLMINENTTNPIANTTTTTGSNTSEQTTETRYYNGKYTKETALKKANDFFNLKNGEKITFTKIDKKSDYQFIGNWIIKSEAENLQSKIEYLFEDDGLKIKINEIVLNDKYGALKMDKNHKDEVARKTAENLYVSINDLFVKAVFAYLDIANNTTQTTTTAGSTSAIYTAVQPNTTAEASSLVAFSKNKPLYFKKITNAQVQFYQDETKITPPEKFFKSHSGDLIAYYEPGYYYIFSNVENATLNTIIKPNYQIANDFYYEVLSKDKTYVNRKGKYLKLSDFKLYVEANDVLNFMFPEEDVTYTSNMGNGPLYSKYYSGGKFKGTDYLDIKKDKSFDLIRRGVRIPKSDYEVKVDIQNDNQAFIYYKGKKEFKISNYKSFFEQAYLRPILRVQ